MVKGCDSKRTQNAWSLSDKQDIASVPHPLALILTWRYAVGGKGMLSVGWKFACRWHQRWKWSCMVVANKAYTHEHPQRNMSHHLHLHSAIWKQTKQITINKSLETSANRMAERKTKRTLNNNNMIASYQLLNLTARYGARKPNQLLKNSDAKVHHSKIIKVFEGHTRILLFCDLCSVFFWLIFI